MAGDEANAVMLFADVAVLLVICPKYVMVTRSVLTLLMVKAGLFWCMALTMPPPRSFNTMELFCQIRLLPQLLLIQ